MQYIVYCKSKTGNALLDQLIVTLATFGDVYSQAKRRSNISITTRSTLTTMGLEEAADKTRDVSDTLAMSALI